MKHNAECTKHAFLIDCCREACFKLVGFAQYILPPFHLILGK